MKRSEKVKNIKKAVEPSESLTEQDQNLVFSENLLTIFREIQPKINPMFIGNKKPTEQKTSKQKAI
jgi:hypothetical protein